MSCLSFLPPRTARLLFWRLVTGLRSLPSPLSPCLAAAAGRPDLCPASPAERGEHPAATALSCGGFEGSSKGRVAGHSWGWHSLLSHATGIAPTLIKKPSALLFWSKYLSPSGIPEQNTPATGMLLLIWGNLLHGPLLSNPRLTLIIHYFAFLPVSLLLNALCHPAY